MNTTSTIQEHFTGSQALGLLWVDQKDTLVHLELTKAELRHLQLTVIDEFEFIDSPYRKKLITKDKLELLSLMLNQKPIFK